MFLPAPLCSGGLHSCESGTHHPVVGQDQHRGSMGGSRWTATRKRSGATVFNDANTVRAHKMPHSLYVTEKPTNVVSVAAACQWKTPDLHGTWTRSADAKIPQEPEDTRGCQLPEIIVISPANSSPTSKATRPAQSGTVNLGVGGHVSGSRPPNRGVG